MPSLSCVWKEYSEHLHLISLCLDGGAVLPTVNSVKKPLILSQLHCKQTFSLYFWHRNSSKLGLLCLKYQVDDFIRQRLLFLQAMPVGQLCLPGDQSPYANANLTYYIPSFSAGLGRVCAALWVPAALSVSFPMDSSHTEPELCKHLLNFPMDVCTQADLNISCLMY